MRGRRTCHRAAGAASPAVLALIRHRIGSQALTVSQMAARLEISQPRMSNLLWGKRQLSDSVVEHAIVSLRITPEQLYSQLELRQIRQSAPELQAI